MKGANCLSLMGKLLFCSGIFMLASCSDDEASAKSEVVAHPGEEIYVANCKVCHAQGINGAPILGNKAMWSERAPRGEATLVQHAIHGFELMPGNLGRNGLTEDQIGMAVSYMLSELNK